MLSFGTARQENIPPRIPPLLFNDAQITGQKIGPTAVYSRRQQFLVRCIPGQEERAFQIRDTCDYVTLGFIISHL
ncbi:hypothetical protein PoB_007094500 [Plakobranchus ocellatus]|uniref:Uncharacterized protein n=1 Tax=Plakobranchus ocellatus TaxID=259542 RepID=A0AAV4DJW2_9GAST|nr:hypothetical protein PoB_007094500 [Plakobranchus ocellatus]